MLSYDIINNLTERYNIIVGREHIVYFENLIRKQEQIYNDACDYGILTKNLNMSEIKEITDDLKKTFVSYREEWFSGASIEFFIPYEIDNQLYSGVKLKITYANDKARKIKFMTFDLNHCYQKEPGFIND